MTKAMKLELPAEIEARIQSKIDSGLYRDATEVVSAAMAALERDESGMAEIPDNVDELRAMIDVGLEDMRAGRVTTVTSESELRALIESL